MPKHRAAVLCLLLACLPFSTARADDDDTRFLLDQTRRTAERRMQPVESLVAPPGTVVHEGRIYEVGNNLQDLEPAIYIALNTGQWDRLVEFVGRYRLLRDYRPELVDMANGLLARHRGLYGQALEHLSRAHAANPGDARIQLELARLQFEDNRDADARATFELARSSTLPDYGRVLTEQYLSALDARAGWHGNLAFGMGYNDNINQTNGSRDCLSEFWGICLFERKMPDPIGSAMLNYELALERRFNLSGNHNLLLRPVSYGSHYRHDDPQALMGVKDYSSNTALLYLGYQYLDARNSVSMLPYVEHYYRDGYTNYLAPSLQLEWRHALDNQWQIGGSLDTRRYHHKDRALRITSDYDQYQASLFASYMPTPVTSIHGGIDATRKKYEVAQASSKEWTLRAGVYHQFAGEAGMYVNLLGIYREIRNDAFDGFLARGGTTNRKSTSPAWARTAGRSPGWCPSCGCATASTAATWTGPSVSARPKPA
ncbi:porin family protein [Thauera sp. SDU_THAU2]|uniref:porin family protein n=1 Tax=Thauera sp. SDU_THAU2 TaxID=3136633 RepID=UPI00311E856E